MLRQQEQQVHHVITQQPLQQARLDAPRGVLAAGAAGGGGGGGLGDCHQIPAGDKAGCATGAGTNSVGNNVHPLIKPLLPARLLFAPTPAARAHCAALPHCSLEEGDDKLHQPCIPLIHARVARQRVCQHAHHCRQGILSQEGLPHRLHSEGRA